MATATKEKPTRPPALYTGQQACDFRPEWDGLTGDGVALAEGCWAATVGDHLPWLVLADWLDERGDGRGLWVRQYVHWEQFAQAGKFRRKTVCEWDDRQESFATFTETESGWRWVGLWNAIAARWCPDGYGIGPQVETWADERVRATNVWCVLWSCRLAAWNQADAAGNQAYAAGRQAYAAGSQAYAAWSQAYAAGRQADAAVKRCRKWIIAFWSAMSAGFPFGV